MGSEQGRKAGMPEAVAGPGQSPRPSGELTEQIHRPAAGAVVLPPAEEPPTALLQGVHAISLKPGGTYVLAYDRAHVSQQDATVLLHWLDKRDIKAILIRTHGDPRKAIQVMPAEELNP